MRPAYYFTGFGGNTPLNYWLHNLAPKPLFDPNANEATHYKRLNCYLLSFFEPIVDTPELENFLNAHYDKFLDAVIMGEEVTPFFEHLIYVINNPPERGIGPKIYKAIISWINSHPDYFPSSLEGTSSYDKPNTLSSRQIAIIIYYGRLKNNGTEATKLLKNSKSANKDKINQHYSKFHNGTGNNIPPDRLEGSAQTRLLNDFVVARNYLTGESRTKVEQEVKKVWPEYPFEN